MYQVCLNIDKNNDLLNNIINKKENLKKIPNKGVFYGKYFGYDSNLPKVTFNYLGQFDSLLYNSNNDWLMTNENSGISNPIFHFEYFSNATAIVYNRKFSFKLISTLSRLNLSFFLNIFKNKILEILDFGKIK